VTREPLRLTVVTPAGTLLDVPEVAWVQVLLADGGGMGIYPGHAPLLAETRAAPLRYAVAVAPTIEHQTEDLEGGILQIAANQVLLLTGGPAFAPANGDLPSPEEIQQFDRLAGTLLAALQAASDAAWGIDGEDA
jgi:F0F1-type ATP synthase epsilon subunit